MKKSTMALRFYTVRRTVYAVYHTVYNEAELKWMNA